MNNLGARESANLGSHERAKSRIEIARFIDPVHKGDIGIDRLPFDVVRIANHRRFGDARVQYQRTFNLGSAQTVSRNIDDIVDAAGYPVEAIGIAVCAVAGKVIPRIRREICVDTALVVAVDTAKLAWPGLPEN